MIFTNNTNSSADCIRTVCKHYSIRAGNIPASFDVEGIIEILNSLDFYACDLHTNMKGLRDCPKPAIVQTTTGFMTVVDANKVSIKITYNSETHRLAYLDFIKIWTGVVIAIEPPPSRRWAFFEKWFE
jgi:hypothetical protein